MAKEERNSDRLKELAEGPNLLWVSVVVLLNLVVLLGFGVLLWDSE